MNLERKNFLHYDSKTIFTEIAGAVPLPEWVNGLTVFNAGNTNVLWDNDTIVPGDFKAVGGNVGEIFVGNVVLKFALPSPPPATPENMAVITCKFYVQYN